MKSQLELMRRVLIDMGTWCCTSTTLDMRYIERRVEGEGDSFTTITLPSFAKDLERGLDQGYVDSTMWLGLSRKGCLPAFLQGFTSQIFDQKGILRPDASIDAIRAVRQVCNLFGKVDLECSVRRTRGAFRQYIETDNDLRHHWMTDVALRPDSSIRWEFRETARAIYTSILSDVEQLVFDGGVMPHHGPGATADRLFGNAKFNCQTWTQRLEEIFPHGEYLFPNWRHFDANRVEVTGHVTEIPVRVISVPKTQKTPRIIAIEPAAVQYVQQGLMVAIVEGIEWHRCLSSLIGFRDQTPNQEMAREGSITGALATLDLSEASDRVAWPLVQDLLDGRPFLTEAVAACRSQQADVPEHGIHSLFKFASMGSALCFPVEAMVFLNIIAMAWHRVYRMPPSQQMLKQMLGKVRVYGDDLIVPVECAESVSHLLSVFGLKVNVNKSFWTGKFRESCGKDYYDGHDVSYVKVRRVFPETRKHVPEIVSAVSLRNQLFKAGFNEAVDYLDDLIERLIPFPRVAETSPVLGRHVWDASYDVSSMCPKLQRPLVVGAVVKATPPRDPLDGYGALVKYFLKRGDEPLDKGHLSRAGRADIVRMKIGKAPVY